MPPNPMQNTVGAAPVAPGPANAAMGAGPNMAIAPEPNVTMGAAPTPTVGPQPQVGPLGPGSAPYIRPSYAGAANPNFYRR